MPSAPKKPCPTAGCPELIITGQRACALHAQQNEVARGTPAERGYGAKHVALRKKWEPLVSRGVVNCVRCGKKIPAEAKWDLGHDDNDRSKYTGPEHQGCNRRAGGRSVKHRGGNR